MLGLHWVYNRDYIGVTLGCIAIMEKKIEATRLGFGEHRV